MVQSRQLRWFDPKSRLLANWIVSAPHRTDFVASKFEGAAMTTYTHISVERSVQDKIATVTMRRAEVHNALNAQLIADLQAAFTDLSTHERLHAVVLTGEGRSFSAGADVKMMAEAAALDEEQNMHDALRLADAFDSINNFP